MDTEDIIAEPEDVHQSYFGLVVGYLHAYGWYIILAAVGIYFYVKPRFFAGGFSGATGSSRSKSPEDTQAWQAKEEQRLRAVERLQAKYAQDATIKAERQKVLDEEKRRVKLEEKQKLAGMVDVGQKLGDGDSSKKSFRPEYNPLMGDQGSSSGRVCFRRPGGGAGGG